MSLTKIIRFTALWGGLVFNLRGLASLHRIFPYVRDWVKFARDSDILSPVLDAHPCLSDATQVTPFDPHYFFQGAWLARKLAGQKSQRHVDIGSDISLVSVISAFVETLFIDYRPLEVALAGMESRQGDILRLDMASDSVSSLSCLHVVEHIGLGRYGDPIDTNGHVKAAKELSRVLAAGGSLFLTLPVGHERVCFNAHRILSPHNVIRIFSGLQLHDFSYVDDNRRFHEHVPVDSAESCEYGCGMFHFIKS